MRPWALRARFSRRQPGTALLQPATRANRRVDPFLGQWSLIVATSDYSHGDMNVTEQSRTLSGFLRVTVWSSLVLIVVLLFATLNFAVGMGWFVSLGIAFAVGVLLGLALGMKGAWYATVVGIAVFGGFIGVMASLIAMLTAG